MAAPAVGFSVYAALSCLAAGPNQNCCASLQGERLRIPTPWSGGGKLDSHVNVFQFLHIPQGFCEPGSLR